MRPRRLSGTALLPNPPSARPDEKRCGPHGGLQQAFSELVMKALASIYAAAVDGDSLPGVVGQYLAADVDWYVAHPVNTLTGVDAVIEQFLQPLTRAMPDMERRAYIEIPGEYQGQPWIAGTGYFSGTFCGELWGIPATNRTLHLRYTELVRFNGPRIAEYYIIPDLLDAMWQAGVYPLRRPLGYSGLMLPPASNDGICAPAGDATYSASSVQLVMDMLDCLRRYDGVSLESMDLENFWHPDFMWYGPGGIGTTRGIAGFRQHHQGPFLSAFPDRDVDHHACTVASGDYVATGGWPHMHGTHSGAGWLGLPPTGVHLELRVMDIWRREGALLKENWVAIDIPQMLAQMGLDIFEQLKTMTTGGGTNG
jgi:predicted ester cyclase